MCCLPVSWAVHGLRGGATVNASAGLQHQNSGHKVRLRAAHLLLAFSHLGLVCQHVGEIVILWSDLEKRWQCTLTHTPHLSQMLLARFLFRFPSLLLACLFLSV